MNPSSLIGRQRVPKRRHCLAGQCSCHLGARVGDFGRVRAVRQSQRFRKRKATPSNSSRICRGPHRTMLFLVERGGLTNSPEALVAALLDPGANDTPSKVSRLPPLCKCFRSIGTSLEIIVVASTASTHDFSTRGGPNVLQQHQRTVRSTDSLESGHTAEVCVTRVVATTRTTSTLSPGHPWLHGLCQPQSVRTSWLPCVDPT